MHTNNGNTYDTTEYRCTYCGHNMLSKDVLRYPYPMGPDEDILGCPHCNMYDGLEDTHTH